MSPGRVFSLFFSARLWKSFCFTPMNRIERNLENSSLPLQVSLHFFWITQVSIASRQNIWQEVVPCVLIYRSAPFLVKHPASALFTGSSSPSCLTFRYTFPHPAGKHSLPFGVHFLAAHCRAVAFLHQNLLCPMLSCLCQFVFFFPCHHLVPNSSSLEREMTNCHFFKHPLLHQLLLKRQWDKWNSAFKRLSSFRKYSTHKWGASKSIPSS